MYNVAKQYFYLAIQHLSGLYSISVLHYLSEASDVAALTKVGEIRIWDTHSH